MFTSMIERTIARVLDKQVQQMTERQTIPVYGQSALTIYQISNGWIIASQNGALTYVQEAADLGDHILACVTRDRMGIPEDVRINMAARATQLSNAVPYRP